MGGWNENSLLFYDSWVKKEGDGGGEGRRTEREKKSQILIKDNLSPVQKGRIFFAVKKGGKRENA